MKTKIAVLIIILTLLCPIVASAKIDWGLGLGGNTKTPLGDMKYSFGIGSGNSRFGFGGGGVNGGGGWDLGNIMSFGLPQGSITDIFTGILLWILRLFGIFGVIGFVISGILYLTSAGDETKMGTAKRAMTYSIIGVLIGLAGLVIIKAIDLALNSFSNF